MILRTAAFLFATTALCHAQQAKKAFEYSKERLDSVSQRYGISEALARSRTAGQTEIADLAPVQEWVSERYKISRSSETPGKPLRVLNRSFEVILSEDAGSRTFYEIRMRMMLTDNSQEAGRTAATGLAGLNINYDKGSFSGSPVGDWTTSWFDDSNGAALRFIRRNAHVFLSYQGPFERSKQDKTRRRIPDASLRQKCEELARDIDDQLVRLPGVRNE